jgi:peptidoglycan/xylan/chitin deacetylase (PgdA/CDA1 family)
VAEPSARPPLSPAGAELPALDGARLIVQIAVNVELWAYDQPMPRAALPAPHGRSAVPDVPNFAWAEYGLRAGLPRIMELLARRGLPANAMVNSAVIDEHPRVAEAILEAGWEFIGHGVRQRSLASEPDERAVIVESLDRVERFTGRRPRGWLGPGLQETFETVHVLKESGIDYVLDWVVDDVPAWLETRHGPLIALPYTLELNDSVLHAVEHQPSAALHDRLVDTVAAFETEIALQPRVVTLALHPHLIGVPHRSVHLARALDVLLARSDTTFVTAERIADWFIAATRGRL